MRVIVINIACLFNSIIMLSRYMYTCMDLVKYSIQHYYLVVCMVM